MEESGLKNDNSVLRGGCAFAKELAIAPVLRGTASGSPESTITGFDRKEKLVVLMVRLCIAAEVKPMCRRVRDSVRSRAVVQAHN